MAVAESAIKALLEANSSDLSSATAIWALQAPQDAVKPYAVFEVDDEEQTETMSQSVTPTLCQFSVQLYADSMLQIINATSTIRTALGRYSGTIGGVVVQAIFFKGRRDIFDDSDREYERELFFDMYYEE